MCLPIRFFSPSLSLAAYLNLPTYLPTHASAVDFLRDPEDDDADEPIFSGVRIWGVRVWESMRGEEDFACHHAGTCLQGEKRERESGAN